MRKIPDLGVKLGPAPIPALARSLAVAALLCAGSAGPAVAEATAEPAATTAEPAAASAWAALHASRARLVASAGRTPGGKRLAGLEVVLDDGWKTYWRMPGDAGVPPSFEWAGSGNAAIIKVLYPAPKRIPEAGGEVIGYKQAVLLPIEVTPKDPSKPVALKLALELAVCREICVPATATLDVTLPPAGAAAPKDAIAAALERVPRPQAARRPDDPNLIKVSAEGEGSVRLVVQAAFTGDAGDVFVEGPEGIYVPMLRKGPPAADGTTVFSVDLSPDLARDLKGKSLTLTLVSETGASEAQWTFP
jgi:DsbC/DsbD-like thiol-disulfide interchange protein